MTVSEILLKSSTIIAMSASGLTALSYFFGGMLALRAKRRALVRVREALLTNQDFAELIDHARRNKIDQRELDIALASIEKAISSMSESDKKYVEEGLHQPLPSDTRRYVKELLTGAAAA